jgi:hypothetical protein
MTNVRIYPIHIRTISTNAIHPLAQQSPLQLFTAHPVTEELHGTAIDTATLQIARNTVALYFLSSTHKPRVLIFDWTTSELILVRPNFGRFDISHKLHRIVLFLLNPFLGF